MPVTVEQRKIGVVGIPFSKGQPKSGTQLAPNIIRQGGILDKLKEIGNEVVDYGDVTIDDVTLDDVAKRVARPRNVGGANKKVSEMVEKIVKQDQLCLMLGGDHSLAMGSIHGHQKVKEDLVVVWIDAHADINTPSTTPSGNLHGMPLSFLVKELASSFPRLPGFDWLQPCISAKDIVYIGLRDVDEGEKAIIDKLSIPYFSMQEVDKYGIGEVVDMALRAVDPSGSRPIHVSFDVDALDPVYTPSTGTPVSGGLSLREGFYIAEQIAATGRLSAVDCVEVNPLIGSKDDQQRTVAMTVDVTSRFFGNKRAGFVKSGYTLKT